MLAILKYFAVEYRILFDLSAGWAGLPSRFVDLDSVLPSLTACYLRLLINKQAYLHVSWSLTACYLRLLINKCLNA